MSPASDWFARGMATLRGRDQPSEGDVSGIIVRRCLSDVLKIDDDSIHAEQSAPGARPDFVCWHDSRIEVIVEVKNLNTNLERRIGKRWTTSPVGQLQKYLRKFPGVQEGTWGILTNACEWRLFIRSKNDCILHDICTPRTLEELSLFLQPILHMRSRESGRPIEIQTPSQWIHRLQSGNFDVEQFVEMTAPNKVTTRRKSSGIEWVYARLDDLGIGQISPPLPGAYIACIRLPATDGLIRPPDITDVLAGLPVEHMGQVHGIALVSGAKGGTSCCGFLRYRGELRKTATFDPEFPGSRIERQLSAIARLDDDPLGQNSLNAALDVLDKAALQEDFYSEIDDWFNRTNRTVNELRYLIRVMFAWLLQERGIIPDTALWNQRPLKDDGTEIHDRIETLFVEVLATEPDSRRVSTDDHDEMPFLNGSLFTELKEHDRPQQMINAFYRSSQTSTVPGLLDILARYDWTLSEPTGSEIETALDPSMLGLLFERLMLNIKGPQIGKGGKNKFMPSGTYYTPQDIADEMVADAIAVRVGESSETSSESIRQLAHPVPVNRPWLEWTAETKSRLINLLKELTILDPCCGSGAFTVTMLQALQRCFRRLDNQGNGVPPERVIERQLHAADIEPLAILITRLRLFISIVESRLSDPNLKEIAPLPNLETRCVCIDSLHMNLSSQMAIADENWEQGIGNLRAAMEMWVSAYSARDKQIAHDDLEEARSSLRELGALGGMNTEWLETDLTQTPENPATVDVRLLLAAPDGWDIVIGNPPYLSVPQARKTGYMRLGYSATSDLYTLFLEAAIAATRANGCIVMITPHSIVFKRQKAWIELRKKYEDTCESIDFRTYDNRPAPVFPRLPWLKTDQSDENRQRVTILVAKKTRNPVQAARIFSRGLIRLTNDERRDILRNAQRGMCQPPSIGQWTQAPTKSTLELLNEMRDSDSHKYSNGKDNLNAYVTFPATAMYFITCVPEGLIVNRSRRIVSLADDQFYWPWIGLYNSHLFHGYWLMMGDAFHLTDGEIKSIRPPLGWNDDTIRAETEQVARELCSKETVAACRFIHRGRGGTEWPNANFHQAPADRLIERLDQLLIRAYGLDVEPLLSALRTMRTGSAHEIRTGTDV